MQDDLASIITRRQDEVRGRPLTRWERFKYWASEANQTLGRWESKAVYALFRLLSYGCAGFLLFIAYSLLKENGFLPW